MSYKDTTETAGAKMARSSTLLSEELICAAMEGAQTGHKRNEGNLLTEAEKLLIEQTRIALTERFDADHYLVVSAMGIVKETLSGREAMLKYEDLRLSGAKAILLAPGKEFILDHQGKPRLIEEIMKDIREETAGVLDQLCD